MRALASMLMLLCLTAPLAAAVPGGEMARIPGGTYTPLFVNGEPEVRVAAFALDRYPVTRGEYLAFVRANAAWRRDQASRGLAGSGYLASWPAPLSAGSVRDGQRPVTEISWFAARAYCGWRGKRLPSTDEWEYAARASETTRDASRDPAFVARLLALYTRPRADAVVGSTFRSVYGVWDLHGLVWEWTADYNSLLVSDDSRATGGRDHQLYCAAGVIGATDVNNYPAFLRYGLRSGLDGRTTTRALGFRCAQDLP
jgi:formylglycine-generating enzyme